MVYYTRLGQFCDFYKDWEERLSQSPYCLKIKRDENYIMFNYNQLESDFSNDIVRESRGIIFREGEWKAPVCHAFDKFGNYGESYVPEIDWSTAVVTEKVDGSLIKFWYDGRWRISTNGTINAFKAENNNVKYKTFGDLVEDTCDLYGLYQILDKRYTYMFELVGPYNRVVIPYEENNLYFLGYRDNQGVVPFHKAKNLAEKLADLGIKTPKCYKLGSLEECLNASSVLPWDEEGYVVDDAKGDRAKIKSPAYVMAHYTRTSKVISERVLIDIILKNEIEEFLTYAEDYRDNLEATKNKMDALKKSHEVALDRIKSQFYESRKEYAQAVKEFQEWLWPYLFLNFDNYVSFDEYTKGWNVEKWERMINNEV